MKFPSIRIEGSIFSPDILEKIEQGEIGGQKSADFGFDVNIKVKDEIAKAWADANSLWKVFKSRIENLKETDSGTSETRKYLMIPFLGLLGYDIENYKSAQEISGKSYAISHHVTNLDNFPIQIMGVNDSLDKRRQSGGPRMSPHSLIQEYINLSEHLYAIVTNGLTLRLLRDSSRLVKLSYIEFDVEKIFEEDQYTDFALLYRLLHSSRMPSKKDLANESLIEKYHLDALESGSRIRDGLSQAVEDSIKLLGSGFLNNPNNKDLIEKVNSNETNVELFHVNLLRLIYRILFLLVIEERGLVYPEKADSKLKNIYYDFYSVSSLRKISELRFLSSGNLNNLWIQLKNTFRLFLDQNSGKTLELKPLAGDLFGENAIELLNDCDLDNRYLMECIRNLNFYKNEKGQSFRVNYAALSVEEFGSVYEGLLEFKPEIQKLNGKYDYVFVQGAERSKSGSHYTPDELVQPLIKHSLDYIIEDKLKEKDKVKALLSIKVCDVACGSGHILLNAARRIAIELAKARTGEDQPNPVDFRKALRDVIKNCIYGVDKNPLAVELCKVALWLESHNPGEPLNFLDHKIKCGDSIVGLAHKEELERGIATEAFKNLPGDDKEVSAEFRKTNKYEITHPGQHGIGFLKEINKEVHEISGRLKDLSDLPETTPEEVEAKREKYLEINSGHDWWRLKVLADLQVAQFFIPKTIANNNKLMTNEEYLDLLKNKKQLLGQKVGEAMAVSQSKKFFHWFYEFPKVFEEGGFDCIIGNPPFLGGQKLSGSYGDNFLEFIKYEYTPIGAVDLVTYFFRRIFNIINEKGFLSLISTNTIAQGRAREDGLDIIVKGGGIINHAVKSMRWPGEAAVEVALVTITKQKYQGKYILSGKSVSTITPYLDDAKTIGNPYPLKQNEGKSFQGSIVLGKGFILEPCEAKALIEKNPKNKDVLFPYLNGDDLNNNPDQSPSRWVINFFDWDKDYCKENYPDCFEIIERLVKPERTRVDENGDYVLRKPLPQKWWVYAEKRPTLYSTIKNIDRVLVMPLTTKYLSFNFIDFEFVVSHAAGVISDDNHLTFSLLQNNFHEVFSWKISSTMGGNTLRYTPSTAFESYPFPQNKNYNEKISLEKIGEIYYEYRSKFMHDLQLGLTRTYNQFHNSRLSESDFSELENFQDEDIKVIEKKFGKETSNLIRHFRKGEPKITLKEAVKGIEKLRQLHKEMDEAVLEAYGWSDVELKHDFYEVDYLPENDRVRFSIHPDARREILKRLLELNHKIHEEEVKAGLWEKKKEKKKAFDKVAEPEGRYGLFDSKD